MISIIPLLVSLVGFFALDERNTVPTEPLWRKIVLMRSTREDVERLLGRSQYRGYSAIYTVENGTLQVEYYLGLSYELSVHTSQATTQMGGVLLFYVH